MSTIEDFRSTTFAAVPHQDLTVAAVPYEDLTVAEAWASSPLGDPEIEDGSLSEPAELEDCPATTVIAKPRSRRTNAMVAGAVVAAIGAVAGLGLFAVAGTRSNQPKPATVIPNSSVGSVTPQAPSAVPPSPVAPAPPSVTTPPDAGQPPAGPADGGGAPIWSGPAPAPAAVAPADPAPYVPAYPGTPPPAPYAPVNVPPVIPVPIPIPVPPYKDGDQHGSGQPAPSGGHGPIECLACHPQPIHPQPIHPQPIHPQPIHPQPIHPQPIHSQPIQQPIHPLPIQQHH